MYSLTIAVLENENTIGSKAFMMGFHTKKQQNISAARGTTSNTNRNTLWLHISTTLQPSLYQTSSIEIAFITRFLTSNSCPLQCLWIVQHFTHLQSQHILQLVLRKPPTCKILMKPTWCYHIYLYTSKEIQGESHLPECIQVVSHKLQRVL